MRLSLSLSLLLLAPGWAQADDSAHVVAGASARETALERPGVDTDPPRGSGSAAYVGTFEAQVELLDRSVERAVRDTMGALVALEYERLAAELDRSLDGQIAERMVSGPARTACAGRPAATQALLPSPCGDRPGSEDSRLAANRRALARREPPLCCVALNEASPTTATISEIRPPASR